MKANKIFFTGMGALITLAGFLAFFKQLADIIIALLFFVAGLILIVTVGFQKILDNKVDFNDVSSIIAFIFSGILFFTGFLIAFGLHIPDWMNVPIVIAMTTVGITVALIGFKSR